MVITRKGNGQQYTVSKNGIWSFRTFAGKKEANGENRDTAHARILKEASHALEEWLYKRMVRDILYIHTQEGGEKGNS